MCQVTTDNASNFVKSFTQFQQREQGLIPIVMEEDESETTTTGDNLPGGEEEEEEEEDEDEEGDSDTDSVRVRREESRRRSKKKKGTAEDPEEINIELEDQQEPDIVEATEILEYVTNPGNYYTTSH